MAQSQRKTPQPGLKDQVEIARKSMREWPQWMKEAARFEGSNISSKAVVHIRRAKK
jgi:hypothetical protein